MTTRRILTALIAAAVLVQAGCGLRRCRDRCDYSPPVDRGYYDCR